MPKSDTWPGGVGLEMMISSDSAGSCDSVVSANSGCVSYRLYPLKPGNLEVLLQLIIQNNMKYQGKTMQVTTGKLSAEN